MTFTGVKLGSGPNASTGVDKPYQNGWMWYERRTACHDGVDSEEGGAIRQGFGFGTNRKGSRIGRSKSMTDSLKENLRKADEWLKNLKDTFPNIKDEYKGYAADRINLLEWLIEQVKSRCGGGF